MVEEGEESWSNIARLFLDHRLVFLCHRPLAQSYLTLLEALGKGPLSSLWAQTAVYLSDSVHVPGEAQANLLTRLCENETIWDYALQQIPKVHSTTPIPPFTLESLAQTLYRRGKWEQTLCYMTFLATTQELSPRLRRFLFFACDFATHYSTTGDALMLYEGIRDRGLSAEMRMYCSTLTMYGSARPSQWREGLRLYTELESEWSSLPLRVYQSMLFLLSRALATGP